MATATPHRRIDRRIRYWSEDRLRDLRHRRHGRPGKLRPSGPANDTGSTDTRPSATRNLVGAALAELIGTFMFVGVSLAVLNNAGAGLAVSGIPLDSTATFIVFGLMLLASVALFAERSGANFNPAITLALAVFKKMEWRTAFVYWAAQFIGAFLGSLLLAHLPYAHLSHSDGGFGLARPAAGVGIIATFWVEFIGTFLLTLVVAAVAVTRQLTAGSLLAIGSVIAAVVAFGGPITGGAFNPARAIAPMITSGQFPSEWPVYVIAPALGAIVALGLHLKFFVTVQDPSA